MSCLNKIKQNIQWILIAISACIFIILLINIINGNIIEFDNKIYQWISTFRTEQLTNILTVITNLGGIVGLFFIALITVIVLFILKKRKYGIAVAMNLFISTTTYIIIKNIIQRARPIIDERLIEETGYSFPSGHTTNNVAFYGLLIYLVCKTIKIKWLRNVLYLIFSLIIVTIAFSRIYLRVHYPSDVLAGFGLGFICVTIFINIYFKKGKTV